ncbi:farnesyl pyrophosphate synthase [Solenopsis invicta]|uniref:farnesyl pyrophosphate synthase n=1 Tax=Solenopsis invicta TaxID=13686 RepID=UPI00193D717F|nr:farnesyl pyrophosphate synthase [Solenopsis invicta]
MKMAPSLSGTLWDGMEKEAQEMMAVWPQIMRDVTERVKNIPDIGKWLEKVLQYNVLETPKLHSLTLFYAYKSIAPIEDQTEENIHLARILAWCTEVLIGYLILIDDIMDQSSIRRGKTCWYRHDDTTDLMAINDATMLESIGYYLLQKYFKGKECYNNIAESFQDSIFNGQIGQFFDMKKCNLDEFTMDRYVITVQNKSGQLAFLMPARAGIHYATTEKNGEMLKQTESILLEMGQFYQIQDDCLICFFDVLGKDFNDIAKGKFTWLIVKALERVTPEQRKILEECYGVSDPEKVKRVKQLYIELDLLNAYFKYEEEAYNAISARIQKIPWERLRGFFMGLLGKLYRRRVCYT